MFQLQDWDLGEGKEAKKCRVRLEALSERRLERLLMAAGETPETIVTAPVRRIPVGAGHWGREDGITTMLGQKLKIRDAIQLNFNRLLTGFSPEDF